PLLVLPCFLAKKKLTKNMSRGVTPFWHNDTRPRVTVTFGARRYPAYNNTQLRSCLESLGVDLGAAGKDNTYGYGPCVLPTPPVVNQPPTLAPISNLTTNEDAGLVTVGLTGISAGSGENQTLTVTRHYHRHRGGQGQWRHG
ncbi:MAG: hypothetical protein NTW03_08580, partial [Verrucomicrobia bacterium]|nr:hypothetical protein [Verrucomicrobiota bacterium]